MAAESFALDALIDSEIEEVNVVESIRPERLSRLPWLVLGVVAVAVVAVGILAAIVVNGV